MQQILEEICSKYNIDLLGWQPLSGGDINQVYKIKSKEGDFVIKINDAHLYPGMFEVEAKSLLKLRSSNSFVIPEVIGHGGIEDNMYLLLEYIKSEPNLDFSESFAKALAKLHQNNSSEFGLDFNNYIGRLSQENLPKRDSVLDFYINLRLEPQFKMASERGFKFRNIDQFYKTLEDIIPEEKASLIHGDLWSGNYLITENGEACIFDPAVAYAPREMDIAMMKLFGGYPQEIFEIYHNIYPLQHNWKNRIEIWQLYYILVHVNLFGSSYFSQAKGIINKFTA